MKNDKLYQDVKKLTQELEETKTKYLRALADYQNLEKQTQTWKDEFSQYASAGLIKRILEVLDDLENAQRHLLDSGLDLIIAKLRKILAEEGLEEVKLEGQRYDPETAEVVATQPEQEENIVLKVSQKAYKMRNRIVRLGKVIVSTKTTREN